MPAAKRGSSCVYTSYQQRISGKHRHRRAGLPDASYGMICYTGVPSTSRQRDIIVAAAASYDEPSRNAIASFCVRGGGALARMARRQQRRRRNMA